MSHLSTIGAAIFTDLSVSTGTITAGIAGNAGGNLTPTSESAWKAMFANEGRVSGVGVYTGANSFTRIGNVREFPSIGTPPNIVNVPVFGQKQSSTVQGQADAPNLELTINYVPELWQRSNGFNSVLGNMVGDGITRAWRFTLLQNSAVDAASFTCATSSVAAKTTGSATGSISGDILTFTASTTNEFWPGCAISGTNVVAGTRILEQLTGTLGGSATATFRVSVSQNVASTTITAAGGLATLGAPSGSGSLVTGQSFTHSLTGTNIYTIYGQKSGTLGGAGDYYVSSSVVAASGTATIAAGFDGRNYASLATVNSTGLGSTANSQYYWNGKLESLLVKPDLKDALQATLTISIQSDFYGAFTN